MSTTPKLTISTQLSPQNVVQHGHKSGEVSPLPSRALHTSPLANSIVENRDSSEQQGGVLLRKHSKQSLRYEYLLHIAGFLYVYPISFLGKLLINP